MLGKTHNKGLEDRHRRIPFSSEKKSEAMADKTRSFKLGVLVGGGDDPLPPLPRSPAARSPRSFGDGAVGLGIVAAMSGGEEARASARSEPIPIVPGPRPRARPLRAAEHEETSESYTCVISHMGGSAVRKRVYLDDGFEPDGNFGNYDCPTGWFFESPPAGPVTLGPPPPPADFLSRCYLCRKKLHGLDIFMYRGDKAFCSAECRCQQILNDELWEKCGSEALKTYDCSVSPRSTPLLFTAGLAAA